DPRRDLNDRGRRRKSRRWERARTCSSEATRLRLRPGSGVGHQFPHSHGPRCARAFTRSYGMMCDPLHDGSAVDPRRSYPVPRDPNPDPGPAALVADDRRARRIAGLFQVELGPNGLAAVLARVDAPVTAEQVHDGEATASE